METNSEHLSEVGAEPLCETSPCASEEAEAVSEPPALLSDGDSHTIPHSSGLNLASVPSAEGAASSSTLSDGNGLAKLSVFDKAFKKPWDLLEDDITNTEMTPAKLALLEQQRGREFKNRPEPVLIREASLNNKTLPELRAICKLVSVKVAGSRLEILNRLRFCAQPPFDLCEHIIRLNGTIPDKCTYPMLPDKCVEAELRYRKAVEDQNREMSDVVLDQATDLHKWVNPDLMYYLDKSKSDRCICTLCKTLILEGSWRVGEQHMPIKAREQQMQHPELCDTQGKTLRMNYTYHHPTCFFKAYKVGEMKFYDTYANVCDIMRSLNTAKGRWKYMTDMYDQSLANPVKMIKGTGYLYPKQLVKAAQKTGLRTDNRPKPPPRNYKLPVEDPVEAERKKEEKTANAIQAYEDFMKRDAEEVALVLQSRADRAERQRAAQEAREARRAEKAAEKERRKAEKAAEKTRKAELKRAPESSSSTQDARSFLERIRGTPRPLKAIAPPPPPALNLDTSSEASKKKADPSTEAPRKKARKLRIDDSD